MLKCGHVCCCNGDSNSDCGKWIAKHRRCPMCSCPCKPTEMQRISKDSSKMIRIQSRIQPPKPSKELEDITQVFINGSFGTKLDAVIKHVKYLQTIDQGIKIVVFSRWVVVLANLSRGLEENGVKTISFKTDSNAAETFKNDPTITVFMLTSQKQSAGLTLTCATHVFFVEPLLDPSVEAQGKFSLLNS